MCHLFIQSDVMSNGKTENGKRNMCVYLLDRVCVGVLSFFFSKNVGDGKIVCVFPFFFFLTGHDRVSALP